MPSRHRFWVILVGTTPTAFRADHREELLPTLTQLQRTQDDVSLRWFARGRLWNSQVEELDALKAARRAPRARSGDWRPGGTHEDPRKRYEISRDEKRARFKSRQRMGPRPDGDRRPSGDRPPGDRPFSDRPPGSRPPGNRPPGGRPPGSRPPGSSRPFGDRPPGKRPYSSRPPGSRPYGGRPPGGRPKGGGKRRP